MSNPSQSPNYTLYPIGYVRQSEEFCTLEILEPYRPGLKELMQFSHVIVAWWADQGDNPQQRGTLQADLPYARGTTAGVFACRAEYRPNPIALTTCYILEVDEQNGVITLPWMDAFDGTPVLDLKPYIPISDRIRDVKVAEWFKDWPAWAEDAAEFFSRHTIDLGN